MFKSSQNPPTRYALDDFEEDDANLKTTSEYSSTVDLSGYSTVVLLAPRLTNLLDKIPCTQLGTASIDEKIEIQQPEYTDFEGVGVSDETIMRSDSFTANVYKPKTKEIAIVALPRVPPELANEFSRNFIQSLADSTTIWVVSPATFFDNSEKHPVAALYTSHYHQKQLKIPRAAPPTLVQGVCASILSSAERLGRQALGLLAYADGPLGHEAISHTDFDALQRVFYEALGFRDHALQPKDLDNLYV